MTNSDGELIIVDPDGDLILRVGSDPSPQDIAKKQDEGSDNTPADVPKTADEESQKPKILRIRVSSKFMAMCSPVFRIMLNGSFRESQLPLSVAEPPILELPEDDPTTMVKLCQIMQYREETYRSTPLNQIEKLAELSDKYDCALATEPWFHHQLYQRLNNTKYMSNKDLASALNAAYHFSDEVVFFEVSAAMSIYVTQALDQAEFLELLIPTIHKQLADTFEELRKQLLQDLHNELRAAVFLVLDDNANNDRGYTTIHAWNNSMYDLDDACAGQAQRAGTFLKMLNGVELNPLHSSLVSDYSYHHAKDLVAKIATEISEDKSLCCEDEACHSCNMTFRDLVDMPTDVEPDSLGRGICLLCLKKGLAPHDLATRKCQEHLAALTHRHTWSVDPSQFDKID